MKFQTKRIPFISRIRKEFVLAFVVYASVACYVQIENPFSITRFSMLIILIGLCIGATAFLTARKYFYEVEILGDQLLLKGESMNKKLSFELFIPETEISFKGKRNGDMDYYLKFENGSNKLHVNNLFNWDYQTVLEVFYAFKQAKNEKVIWDEKYVIEDIEKKLKRKPFFERLSDK